MNHHDSVVDQFTRQADAFASAAAIRDEQALALLVDACGARADDDSLDVACGPGIVACAFARRVRHARGIDLTPAMIDRARDLARTQDLPNTAFRVGDVQALPWPDASFSIVTSRYAFHHLEQPARVLAEMRRVARPGARIAVMDMVASEDPAKADRFNEMERRRDPSHVRALTLAEQIRLFAEVGLPAPILAHYRMNVDLASVLKASFPEPGDAEVVRDSITASIPDDALGIDARLEAGRVVFTYPITLLVSTRAD